ncbi:hypothetical protein DFH06DRAFT_1119305 [Mycena polygramma]|nr:hypothetical protein DFH06DRAFT_1119305 [Mycena polygramma]
MVCRAPPPKMMELLGDAAAEVDLPAKATGKWLVMLGMGFTFMFPSKGAEEVRANPRAIKSTSPRRAAVGHEYGPDSGRMTTPEADPGPIPDKEVSRIDHAEHDPDTKASEASRTSVTLAELTPRLRCETTDGRGKPSENEHHKKGLEKLKFTDRSTVIAATEGRRQEQITESMGRTASGEVSATSSAAETATAGDGAETDGAQTMGDGAETDGAQTVGDGTRATARRTGPSRGSGGPGYCSEEHEDLRHNQG